MGEGQTFRGKLIGVLEVQVNIWKSHQSLRQHATSAYDLTSVTDILGSSGRPDVPRCPARAQDCHQGIWRAQAESSYPHRSGRVKNQR